MLVHNFRAASKGLGKYCPIKNELQVRKGRKICRFTCGERELRFSSPAGTDDVILISPDATVPELRRSISSILDSYDYHREGAGNCC